VREFFEEEVKGVFDIDFTFSNPDLSRISRLYMKLEEEQRESFLKKNKERVRKESIAYKANKSILGIGILKVIISHFLF